MYGFCCGQSLAMWPGCLQMETASLSLKLLSFCKGCIRSRRQCTDKGIRINGNFNGRGSGAKRSIRASCRRFLLGVGRGGCYRGRYSDGWLALTEVIRRVSH
jgi:hypothetical protein